ncbi:MAG: hypothetical protein HOM11_03325 [Methylococcales bacterium]|nr:hypothetical protein [Methylococcales bacterium]MBT7442980.1 hypothetical protein [Methylococcales bacterium]
MLSDSAKSAFTGMLNYNFTQSVDVGSVKGQWDIKPKTTGDNILCDEFEMLTISTYTFRAMVFLHFTQDDASRSLISQMLQVQEKDMGDEQYLDYIAEISNIFCGAVKRDIGVAFEHCGMSTPNRLSSQCLTAFKQLKTAFSSHITATHSTGAKLNGSLYVISEDNLDFSMPSPEISHAEDDAGELELF